MMKLLFDQNISFRIVASLKDLFPHASQIRLLGLENSSDYEIWEFAKKNNYTIVTFDADFYDISLIKGTPPKIVWLRMGNTSTKQIAICIHNNMDLLSEFINNPDYQNLACLEIE